MGEWICPETGTSRTIHTTAAKDKGAIHPSCPERYGLRLQQAVLRFNAWSSSSAYLPGGRYPVPLAFLIASIPSSMVINGVVFTDFTAPPAAAANANAAILTLFGISTIPTTSYSPKAK